MQQDSNWHRQQALNQFHVDEIYAGNSVQNSVTNKNWIASELLVDAKSGITVLEFSKS